VRVRDDELHARQAALVQLGEQVAPGRLRLLRADGDRQELPVAAGALRFRLAAWNRVLRVVSLLGDDPLDALE
jgi:hypothetical protein